MPGMEDKTFQFTNLCGEATSLSNSAKVDRFPGYKFSLFIQDFFLIFLCFSFGAWVTGYPIFGGVDWKQDCVLCVLPLMIAASFQSYNLYNYHLIFFRRYHLFNLTKALCWSLFSIGIVYFLFDRSKALIDNLYIGEMFLPALGLLVIDRHSWDRMVDFTRSLGFGFLGVGVIALIILRKTPEILLDKGFLPISFLLTAIVLFANRTFMVQIVFNKWLRRYFRRQVVVIGTDEEAAKITSHVIKYNAPFWVAGFVGSEALGLPVKKTSLGELQDLPTILQEENVDELIVTDENIDKRWLISILDCCLSAGVNVWFSCKLMPIIEMKLYTDNFCGIPMIRLCSQKNSSLFNKVKHSFDALVTLPAFLLQLPFFFLIAVAVKLDSNGPVFYRARAVGKNGEEFVMLKFRSMAVSNDNNIHKDYVTKLIKGQIQREGKDQIFKITNDPRITRVGKLLRSLSLDELPQLINVIKGEMSLVGPRPCLPYEYELYKDWYKKRLSVRPGITGLWQVAGRSTVAFEDMILLDLYYIYNRSLMLDLNILIETLLVVFGKRGAY